MIAFGFGTALPLLALGAVSRRQAFLRWHGGLLGAGKVGKVLLGGSALPIAALIVTGLDRPLEAALVTALSFVLTMLTTVF